MPIHDYSIITQKTAALPSTSRSTCPAIIGLWLRHPLYAHLFLRHSRHGVLEIYAEEIRSSRRNVRRAPCLIWLHLDQIQLPRYMWIGDRLLNDLNRNEALDPCHLL